jgi:hypothetical protein
LSFHIPGKKEKGGQNPINGFGLITHFDNRSTGNDEAIEPAGGIQDQRRPRLETSTRQATGAARGRTIADLSVFAGINELALPAIDFEQLLDGRGNQGGAMPESWINPVMDHGTFSSE